MDYKSILIKDTTPAEREKIVAESLSCGSPCESCCACGGLEIDYQQYIDGKKELRELNAEYRADYMQGSNDGETSQVSCAR
jgi:hypothetical protein